ncbi:MAG TPA: ABC transporter ATP-binding protein [Atribacterota bacterium]|nr:ABC transporter ATP-binding protein [Atribacterota bacterium]
MNHLLEIKKLNIAFKTKKGEIFNVLNNVSFTINQGEVLGLVGESGCGKTITSLSIMQLLPPLAVITYGEIWFSGNNLLDYSQKRMIDIRGKEIGMIFQEPMTSLNPVYRVGDQIAEMIMLHQPLDQKKIYNMVIEKLKLVAMPCPEEVRNQYPHELSGGMRQRVMIAMAMACSPRLLIADEPTTALDVTIQAQILDLMRNLKDELNSSILLITHDLGVIAEMCDSVAVMYAGCIVEKASVNELFSHPKHPYTIGLLQSLPILNEQKKRLNMIPGNVPAPKDFPCGCRFAPRCKFAKKQCFEGVPPLLQTNSKHLVSCWQQDKLKENIIL